MVKFAVALALCVLGLPVVAAPPEITYAHDLAPIINTHCVSCHHTLGTGPFPLTSYEDVRKHARQIAEVTRTRYMPPWLPDPGYGDFANPQTLTPAQLQIISDWLSAGAPSGDLAQAPAPPSFDSGWTLGQPDVVVKAGQPFSVPASGTDIFWNFILQPNLKQTHYVRAVEMHTDNPKIFHHANIIIDRFGSITQPFPGMDVTVPRNPLDLDGHFLFIKPGSVVSAEPDGFAWRMDPSTTLILNTHIQPSGKPETVQPTIALYFTDQRPKYSPYLLELEADASLNIPAGARDFEVRDDLTLPIDTKVLAVYPHAHYLGKRLEAFATLPDGTRKWLIRISDWDFNWQGVYRYKEPLLLPAGSVVSMRYTYDNSAANPRNPNHPPKRVCDGNRATDEMAHLWLQIMPASPRDSRRVYAEAWAKHELQKNPGNFAANVTLGSLALARFNALDAVHPLQIATEVNPNDALTRNLYGTALFSIGEISRATAQFEEALRLKPDLLNARFNLAHALAKAGKKDEAIQNLRQILKTNPNDPAATDYLASLTAH